MLGKRGSLGGFQLGSRNLLELKVRQTFEVDAACTVEGQDDLDVGEEALGLIVDAEPQRGPRHTGEVPPAGRPTGLQAFTIPSNPPGWTCVAAPQPWDAER